MDFNKSKTISSWEAMVTLSIKTISHTNAYVIPQKATEKGQSSLAKANLRLEAWSLRIYSYVYAYIYAVYIEFVETFRLLYKITDTRTLYLS
jgi:hypothetical protein